MNKFTLPIVTSVLSLTAVLAGAQAPAPSPAPSDPSAASSPHQRDVTKKPGDEASANGSTSASDAATPHQKQAMSKKHHMKKPKTDDTTPQQ